MTFSSKLALALLPVLALTGCATAPTESATPTPATVNACLIVDSLGLTDGGVNESAYSALKEAVVSLGIGKKQTVLRAAQNGSSIYSKVNALIRGGCNVVVGTGPKLRQAIIRAAVANPDIAFVLVDDGVPADDAKPLADNLKHLSFEASQSAILAGYLAAANSKTGLVATFGSFNNATVRSVMQGFVDGVQLFNDDEDADVLVLGAGGDGEKWRFLNSAINQKGAQKLTNRFFEAGADIVFPVAGVAGVGAGLAAVDKVDKFVIGSDRDWFMDADNVAWRSRVLASTVKQVSRPVLEVIKAYVSSGSVGNPLTNEFVGTLANGGVSLTAERDVSFAPAFISARNRISSSINLGEIPTPKGTTK